MNEQIRVLALLGSRVLYGMERANIRVFEALKSAGCKVLVVVEDHPAFPTIPNELSRQHIDHVPVPFGGRRIEGYLLHFLLKNPILFLAGNWKIYKLIREFSPTHIHIPNPFYFMNCMLALNFTDMPVIYRLGDKPSTHNFFWRFIWRRIIARVNHFVVDSKFIRDKLKALGVPSERITTIYSAPPIRERGPEPNRPPNNTQHFLFIGQLGTYKGVDRLVEAFRQITPIYPAARLTIIGRISEWSGDDWARVLRNQTLANPTLADRVTFAGAVEDIYDYLASTAVLVVPSVCEESFGIVAVEAKAAARPSVVFPRGGLLELIEHGVDGFICRDVSVEALTEGLRYYLDDPVRTLQHGRAAFASMSRLGVDRFAESWLNIYESSLTNHESISKSLSTAR